ncbi:fungal specific transcription factor domain-containing protein [Aspergillus undulatus]|uniref:fungal specific transcription factor domain-containing protein n=1 Tax=Aspergillus undulatus TaxID=1810928 RepID=UPI003CCDEC2E
MPFISKKRFYDIHLAYLPSISLSPEIALPLIAQKLIISIPPENGNQNPRTALYDATKHFYVDIDRLGSLSIQDLQANIIIALYELGHAIYPTVYTTIGTCARYAQAMGIGINAKTRASMNTLRVLTSVEAEERRRAWWAIVILDRFVTIASTGRPLATAHPALGDLLPADDEEWDHGVCSSYLYLLGWDGKL